MHQQAMRAAEHGLLRSEAGPVSQSASTFADTRPGIVALRKLAETMNDSPRVAAQRKLADAMHDSPRMIAQRELAEAMRNGPRAAPVQKMRLGNDIATNGQALRSSSDDVAQRMVLPVYNNALERRQFLDQARMQQKYFGHGKIIDIGNWFFDKNLSGIGKDEDLHIVGHGSNTTVGGMNPAELATVIVTNLGLPDDYEGRIYLETCDSAAAPPHGIRGTYAQRFAEELMNIRPEGSVIDVVGFAGTFALEDALGRAALSTGQPIDKRLKPTLRVSEPGAQSLQQELAAIMQGEIQNIQQEALLGNINFSAGSGNNVATEVMLRTNAGLTQHHQKIGGSLTKRYASEDVPVRGGGRRRAQYARQIVEQGDKDVRARFQMTDEEFRDFEWARTHPKSAKAFQIMHGLAAFSSGSAMSMEHLDPKYWKNVV